MADYNISGLTPAETGDDWFLFDESGTFSVDEDITCNIYLVGGGSNGDDATIYSSTESYAGNGGMGGYVSIAQNVEIPKDTNCTVTIGAVNQVVGTSLDILGTVLSCNDTGCTVEYGGVGARIYNASLARSSAAGSTGVPTPYGFVGSSGGGGGAKRTTGSTIKSNGSLGGLGAGDGGFYNINNGYAGRATNYGCGGGGAGIYYNSGTWHNNGYGSGKSGCIIICVIVSVEIPEPLDLTYNGLTQYPFGESGIDHVTISGDVSAVAAGTYNCTLTLDDGWNWTDGTNEPLSITWEIKKALIPKPSLSSDEFDYEGNGTAYNKTPVVLNYDSNVMLQEGTTTAYKAGDYEIIYQLYDTDSASWEDGTIDEVVLSWKINKAEIAVPCFAEENGNIFTYDGSSHTPVIEGYDSKVMSRSGNYGSRSAVGEYSITYTLLDSTSCYWSDGRDPTDSVILYWEIQKAIIRYPKPTLDNTDLPFTYNGLTQSPTILDFVSGVMTKTGTLSSIAACVYDADGNPIPWEITIEFASNASYTYKWEDDTSTENVNSTEKVVLPWIINKAALQEPYFSDGISSFEFNGSSISPTVEGFNSNTMAISGDTSAIPSGDYTISFTLKDADSAYWINHSGENIFTLNWEIVKRSVPYPTIGERTLPVIWSAGVFTGQRPEITYADGSSSYISLTNYNGQSYPGEYSFTVSLKYPAYSYWSDDESNGSRTENWEIVRTEYEYAVKPEFYDSEDGSSASFTEYDYDGLKHTPAYINYPQYSEYYLSTTSNKYPELEIDGSSTLSATAAGDYQVIFNLLDNNVSEVFWEDDKTKDAYTLNWRINKSSFAKPYLKETLFSFDGTKKTVEIEGFNSNVMTQSSTSVTSAIEVGSYQVIFSLKDTDSAVWDDGTVEDAVLKWGITSLPGENIVQIPTITPTVFTYNGSSQSITIENADTNLVEISGTKSAINAGTYQVTFSLKYPDVNIWSDGSTDAISCKWNINKKIEKLTKPSLEHNLYIYDVVDYTPEISDFCSGKMAKSGDLTQRKAGFYIITITLLENANYIYVWEDDTTDDVALSWLIMGKMIPVPIVSPVTFYYGGYFIDNDIQYRIYYWKQPLIENYDEIERFVTWEGVTGKKRLVTNEYHKGAQYDDDGNHYGIEQYKVGKYYIKVAPIDTDSCFWEDTNTAEKIEIEWSIVREIKLIPKPEILTTEFVYDGTTKTVTLNYTGGGVVIWGRSAVEAGTYSVTVQLYREFDKGTDIYDYRWEDNSITPESYTFDWTIKPAALTIPTIDDADKSYVYDGTVHSPTLINFNGSYMSASGTSGTAAGTYVIILSLTNPASTYWEDGTTTDKTITWIITKTTVAKPTIAPEYLTYDGEVHTVEFVEGDIDNSFVVSGYNSNIMNVGGTTSATIVGDYTVTISLKGPDSCTWDDGTTENVELPWKIIKKIVKLDRPYLEQYTFEYDGTKKTPRVLSPTKDYLETGIVLSEDTSATEAGSYKIIAELKEDHNITYLWGDLSTDPVELMWEITGIEISVPKVSPLEFVYDGSTKTPDITDWDEAFVSVSGILNAVNANTYEIVFSLKSKISTTWTGGGTDDIKYTWVIDKKALDINGSDLSLSPDKYTFDNESHLPDIVGFDSVAMTRSNYEGKTSAGTYDIVISLKSNYTWSDGTTDDVVLTWEIEKITLTIPDITPKSFVYDSTAKTPDTVNYDSNYVTYTGNKSATAAGEYNVVFSLKYPDSCTWSDGTTDDISYDWNIASIKIKVPYIEDTLFVYDGTTHNPTIFNYDSNFMTISGVTSTDIPGKYEITFSLKDTSSVAWEDGVEGDRKFEWEIKKLQVKKPYLTSTEFTYNGGIHVVVLKDFDSDVMNKTGTESAIEVNTYYITVSLKLPKCYEWEDGSSDNIVLDWRIKNRVVSKPTLTPTSFLYDGKSHRPTISGFRASAMTRTNYNYQTNVGDYTITVSLTANYEWEDGSTEPLELEWHITNIVISIPYVENTEFTYDGSVHAPDISEYDSTMVKVLGTKSATNAGDYKIIFRLADNEHNVWSDGTTDDIVIPWTIKKLLLKLEVTNTEFVYNGGINKPTISVFDSKRMTYLSGSVIQAIDAGVYSFTISLKDEINCAWEDGTTAYKSFTWTIGRKAIIRPYLDPNVFEYDGTTHSPTVKGFLPDVMNYLAGLGVNYVRSAVKVGTYYVVICLGDYTSDTGSYVNKNYKWDDESTGYLFLVWYINPKELEYPVLVKDEYEYNGGAQTPEISGFQSTLMEKNGDVYRTYLGTYNIYFTLVDTRNYIWKDGISGNLPWKIIKGKLKKSECIPVQNPVLIYNGSSQIPTWDNYSSSKLEFKGETSGVNAGTYTALFYPNDNYTWEDGTTDAITVEWVIEKLCLNTPTQYGTLYYNGKEQTPTWRVTYRL